MKAVELLLTKGGAGRYLASQMLRRSYELAADEPYVSSAQASVREQAAFRLGWLFEGNKCHNSAAFWFQRSLTLALQRGVDDDICMSLSGVAWNLEILKRYAESRLYYDDLLARFPPSKDQDVLESRLPRLLPAAMFHLHHGDSRVGESIMHQFERLITEGKRELPWYFADDLRGLGNFYNAYGRHEEAVALAKLVMAQAGRFGASAPDVMNKMHGLVAQAYLRRGDFNGALREIGEVFDLNRSAPSNGFGIETPLETLDLLRVLARIHTHQGDYLAAGKAYEALAHALGVYMADWRTGKTSSIRLSYLRLQTSVVHEFVSVWLSISNKSTRSEVDLIVANSLLQLKSNLFLALEGNRLVTFRDWELLFEANRQVASAARLAEASSESVDAVLALEDALFRRGEIESDMVANSFEFLPQVADILHFDFRKLDSLRYNVHTILDYSLVELRPPHKGLAGPRRGWRYIGVRMSGADVRVQDLGSRDQVDAVTSAFVNELVVRPRVPYLSPSWPEGSPNVGPMAQDLESGSPSGRGKPTDESLALEPGQASRALADHASAVYRQVIQPLEPLGNSLVIAPDGALAEIPFHALVSNGRYLVEDFDIVYCHSLLKEEALRRRQGSPGMRIDIDAAGANRDIVLLGDPDYSDTRYSALPGTEREVNRIADLFADRGWSGEQIHKSLGPTATVSRVVAVNHPRILHIAAHGAYEPIEAVPISGVSLEGDSWHRWQDQDDGELSELDRALLQAVLVLSPQAEPQEDLVSGRLLTALELSSLNLVACHLAVLSACETGLGKSERGAGVLGFQYALSAPFAHAGMVSLWSVPDRETSEFMEAFYGLYLADPSSVRSAYLTTLRARCRRGNERVHPYYWAAFVLLGDLR